MRRNFQEDISDSKRFIVTMELVPKAESMGRSIDSVLSLSNDAHLDGRLSAVTITDNPGGHSALSPDVLGKEILDQGMDVIVHFTCRDMNRMGIESRALQLRRLGIKNILALTGDYSGKAFGGQGAPVFDLDSVNLICLFSTMTHKDQHQDLGDDFFVGCAVSPFKWTEAECYAQYYKLCKKVASGARFIMTQLGYDVRKYQELIQFLNKVDIRIPALASIYMLSPRSAHIMNSGKIPGAVVSASLAKKVFAEWKKNPNKGYLASVERTARLAVICSGLGYRGVHLGGIHRSFKTVKRILDRMAEIENNWQDFLPEFAETQTDRFYLFVEKKGESISENLFAPKKAKAHSFEKLHFGIMHQIHKLFFNFDSIPAASLKKISEKLDQNRAGERALTLLEKGIKGILLDCLLCGDCGIQYLGFICPESQCPKHIRNGACGGSRNGKCEVDSEKYCVWYRAYERLALIGRTEDMATGCVPPRMWELNKTSSWTNFHLRKDHQSKSNDISKYCTMRNCFWKD